MSKRPNIFISRDLKKSSILYTLLGGQFNIFNKSLIQFEGLPFSYSYKSFTWVFFYSSNGVRYFLEGSDVNLNSLKVACFGSKTAKTFEEKFGKRPNFIGSGEATTTASQFDIQLGPKDKVLFARALNSQQSVQKLLPLIKHDEVIVYNNTPIDFISIPRSVYLVFTSPLNVESYIKMGYSFNGAQIIAIGKTTRDYIYGYSGLEVLMPKVPSEESICQLILSLEVAKI